ncbi:6-phosphogluconate dehydrogenase C-terminal domain-like protein [Cylindrobasidium torrendii FP15055 ss-10]|uniref:6-phosphogluconate dehydrogenase C-terminal domain-like protein n=1 Tax=Cylindrobasidium torrendii FP15055 ss-10 TaxID=1314674 RepID=A0A0D7BBB7_9AGAR|nr:6-phosphogluconate dehydrogenase C-terminal domain-like protein [Cylindrobasidium torrendii FP15055 ss-10]
MRNILVVGYGAIGAVYAHVFKRSGLARVTVVARSNYQICQDQGMHIQSRRYGDIKGWRPDRCNVLTAADQQYDYVVLTTKCVPEVVKTSKILEPIITEPYLSKFKQPTYLILQNGLNVEDELYHTLKAAGQEPSIIGSCVYIGTNLVAPNVVSHGEGDRPTIGIYRYRDFTTTINTPEEDALVGDMYNILKQGGSEVTMVPEIQRRKFMKNFWNLAFASLATLTGYRLPAIFRDPPTDPAVPYEPYRFPKTAHLIDEHTIPALRATLQELLICQGRAMGFPDTEEGLPSEHADRTITNTAKLHTAPDSNHTPSMALDAQKGNPFEVEVIVGEVVRLAKEYKVEVPRVEMLYALLLVRQNQILRENFQRTSGSS